MFFKPLCSIHKTTLLQTLALLERIIWRLARPMKDRQPPVKSQNFFLAFGNKKMILPSKNQVRRVASPP